MMNKDAGEIMIIAHRGASGIAPENTLAAVNMAWQQDADAVEIDVRLSKDSRVMVIHDDSTKRTAGVNLIVERTTSAKLRSLDVGVIKDSEFAGQRIPFLEEVLVAVPQGKKILIEIKDKVDTVDKVVNILIKWGRLEQVFLLSFDYDIIARCKHLLPQVSSYWLVGAEYDKIHDRWLSFDDTVIQKAIRIGIDGLDLSWAGLERSFVRKIKDAGLGLIVWTVDDKMTLEKMIRNGACWITTNWPGHLRKDVVEIQNHILAGYGINFKL